MTRPDESDQDRDAAKDLCRTLLQSDPQMPYKEVRATGENVGLRISRWVYTSVQRELAGTVGAPARKKRAAASPPAGAGRGDTGKPPRRRRRGSSQQLTDDSKLKSPVMTFAVKYLREKPEADYSEVKHAAEREGYTIYPITYGRAQALLGIAGGSARARKRRRQPRAARNAGDQSQVEDLLRRVRETERERERLRRALQRILDILESSLEED